MAKPNEIHDIQSNHYAKQTKEFTDHYVIDNKDLEKHLDKVEKEFLKVERENAAKNRKDYVNTKLDKNRDELFKIDTGKENSGKK